MPTIRTPVTTDRADTLARHAAAAHDLPSAALPDPAELAENLDRAERCRAFVRDTHDAPRDATLGGTP
ncbi:hypothetical protein [Embleya hyalina]|uniref:Uncharacterized protein n=1 Tax=Embleya hyalina TaxID=516124 RepID=A0A401YE04_9ACTN|nr:hypothetical protein [Embleya hyalina]GCD92833.1 hypothetical protein EHYA_00475 [Embleya hyalina]